MSGDRPTPANEPTTEMSSVASMSGEGAGPATVGQVTLEAGIRPVAIAAMLTCIAIAIGQLISTITPTWPGRFFAIVTFFVSLEGIHAQRYFSQRRVTGADRFRFHFVEWVVILLIVRFGVYLRYGGERLAADVAAWQENLGSFFDLGFIAHSVLIIVFWSLAYMLSRVMQELEASPIERMPSVTDPDHYLRTTMPHQGRTDRQSRLNRIVGVFFGGGMALLLLTGLSQVDVRDLIVLQHSRSSGIILNVLIYFLLGFLIISHAQYTILKANWDLQGIPVLGRVGKRWMLWVLSFLLLIGMVAALLPVSYSVGVLESLFTMLRWIAFAIVQIAFLFLFLISYLISLIMSLFPGQSQNDPAPAMRQATPPPAPAAVANEPAAWWLIARSIIFWTIVIGVVGYSLYHFINDRWGLFRNLSAARLFRWWRTFWRGVTRGTRRTVRRLRETIAERLAARRARRAQDAWRYTALRRLAPRERIRYFYLSTLRRSTQLGFGRRPAMTPLEYEETLAREMPDVSEQVHELTEAFVEARYSEHSIDREQLHGVQEVWRRIKQALGARRHDLRQALEARKRNGKR